MNIKILGESVVWDVILDKFILYKVNVSIKRTLCTGF